jgi:hypothetical protein
MGYQKGNPGNPDAPGRPKVGSRLLFDVRMEAKKYSLEAIRTLVRHMRQTKDRPSSIAAAKALLDRAHGKPEVRVDSAVVHKFAIVPEVMDEAEWLERRGQPVGSKAKKPPDAMHGGNLLDLTANKPDPEPEPDEPEDDDKERAA